MMQVQDHTNDQYLLEANYCGRFKAWQMALMFIGGVLMLFGGLPLITFVVIPKFCQLVGMLWGGN